MGGIEVRDNTLTLDRGWYSKSLDVFNWCYTELGDCLDQNKRWSMTQTFGYTSITFKHEEDLMHFLLVWV